MYGQSVSRLNALPEKLFVEFLNLIGFREPGPMPAAGTVRFETQAEAPFTVAGISRPFNSDTCYQEIPKFWQEWLAKGEERPVMGTYGVCIDMD